MFGFTGRIRLRSLVAGINDQMLYFSFGRVGNPFDLS